MVIIPINDINILAKDNTNLGTSFKNYIFNFQNYINFTFRTYINFKLQEYLLLISENETYITFDSRTIFAPICKLLNVDYKEIDNQGRLGYYSAIFNTKLCELKKVENELDLKCKFPELSSQYERKNELIKKVRDIEYTTKRIYPKSNSLKAKFLVQENLSISEYDKLVSESVPFCFNYFVYNAIVDLTNITSNLPNLVQCLATTIVDTKMIYGMDLDKVSRLIGEKRRVLQ